VPDLVLHRLSKWFGQRLAVDALDLHVADGELVVLVGPSGCGKTTTLRLIAGLARPTDGSIRIGDRVVDRLSPRCRNVAMVFQNASLYPHWNVFGNLAFGLRMRGVRKPEIQQRVTETAGLLGIQPLLDRWPAQLSGGQQQRVALGRALIRRPDLLLLDEPFSSLDAPLRDELRNELAGWQRELRITTVHVTHDQREALHLGQRIIVLDQGRVQQIGTPQEIYDRPANRFVAHFMGSPRMNFFEARLVSRDDQWWVETADVAMRWDERLEVSQQAGQEHAVILGVRPEHLVIGGQSTGEATATWRAQVQAVQMLGPEIWLDLQSASHRFRARVAPGSAFRSGDQVQVGIRRSWCHLFAPGDGRRLEKGVRTFFSARPKGRFPENLKTES
jgi:multiple sugar transport system ATP-binding protein